MNDFLIVCYAEVIKQHRNNYNTILSFISFLIWPFISFIIIYYTYYSFNITEMILYGIENKRDLLLYLAIGSLVYNCFWCMVQGGLYVRYERQNGTLECSFMSPANKLALIYGRSISGILNNTWMYTFLTSIIILNSNLSFDVFVKVIIAYILVLIGSVIWGGFITSLYIISRDVDFIFTLCDEPMIFFSGVRFPTSILPHGLQIISFLFPIYYCLRLVRGMFMNESLINCDLYLCLIQFILALLFMFTLTLANIRLGEYNNRKNGNYSLY